MVFWTHLLLIIILWLSPLWADWTLILIGTALLNIYWVIFGGCHLTKIEAGESKDMTFYYYHLSRYFPNLNKKKVKVVVRIIIPCVMIIVAVILQEIIGWEALLQF